MGNLVCAGNCAVVVPVKDYLVPKALVGTAIPLESGAAVASVDKSHSLNALRGMVKIIEVEGTSGIVPASDK